MLCFDVKLRPEAEKFARQNNIHICCKKIIYHLFDDFIAHEKKINRMRKDTEGKKAVFPCVLR